MLALLAGQGRLPDALVAALDAPPVICALDGHPPDNLDVDLPFRVETLGTLIEDLRGRGVTEMCFAGAIRRPRIDPARIDAATMPMVPALMRAVQAGDDAALRAVMDLFEARGIAMRAAHDIAPALVPEAGCPTRAQPGAAQERDAQRAAEILSAMAASDIGQACVVKAGQALAVEGLFGTDWMLASLAARPDGTGGLLFKAPKPGQDRRADLPTIGLDTVAAAAQAGLDGLVIEAGGVIVLDRAEVISTCDAAGLFLWIRPADAP